METVEGKLNIIVLTETRFPGEGGGRNIVGYLAHHTGRVGGMGGGVSIYSVSSLHAYKLNCLSLVNEHIETCVIKVRANQRDIVVLAVYRPPNGCITEFTDYLVGILNDGCVCNCEVIVTGDLNIDLTEFENASSNTRYFTDHIFTHSFLPLITRPTRFPSGGQYGSPSILDHIWCNRYGTVIAGIFIYDVTDHLPTFLILKDVLLPITDLVEVKFRDKSVKNMEKFIQECSALRTSQLGM